MCAPGRLLQGEISLLRQRSEVSSQLLLQCHDCGLVVMLPAMMDCNPLELFLSKSAMGTLMGDGWNSERPQLSCVWEREKDS